MLYLFKNIMVIHGFKPNVLRRQLHHGLRKNFYTTINLERIEQNVLKRRHDNNVPIIRALLDKLKSNLNNAEPEIKKWTTELQNECLKLPNDTHERIWNYGDEPKITLLGNSSHKNEVKKSGIEFSELCKFNKVFRMDNLSNYTGHKSYYLFGLLVELEQAIIQYVLTILKEKNFKLVSVPDLLPKEIIEACGMQTDGNRSQIYTLDSGYCLSGTAEMSLAGCFVNKTLNINELPIKIAAVSRCYRAETSGLQEEKGIYRVHQFTKVEMFAVCHRKESHEILEHFKNVEIEIFQNLNLDLRLLDMPPSELGTPAYEKYDIEAWMPGKGIWGEISSCSNCTDYQAKRLNLKYIDQDEQRQYAHTVNGTAAAIPRLLIAIIESNQDGNDVLFPHVLRCYLSKHNLTKNKSIPDIKLLKSIKFND